MDGQTKDLLRILAPNPSPLTGPGTTTFLLGQEEVAVIDPGPDDAGHLAAIRQAARGRISHIIVTHAHLDQALAWIAAADVEHAVLTNLHIDMDYQALSALVPKNVEVGFDGWSRVIG